MAYGGPKPYPSAAFILSLIGGILIILDAIVVAAAAAIVGAAIAGVLPGLGALLIALAVVGLIFGIIILIGAFQLRSHPESAKMWGIVILILSLISFIGGGGFYLGAILGIIGGILALVWHAPPAMAMGQPQWGAPPPMAPPPAMGGAPPAGQRFCASCGSPNAAGTQFCAKCGAAMPP